MVDCRSEVLAAFSAFQAFLAAITQIWIFKAVGDKTCPDCMQFDGMTFQVDSVDDFFQMFTYGEVVDETEFMPNIHPNCRCRLVLLETKFKPD
jgi:hypothetical protein